MTKPNINFNRFVVYISDVILQCCRCRTRAHASAWGLSGERLLGFSLFCFPKIQRFSNPNNNERDHQVGRLTNRSDEELLRFSLIFHPFCFLFIHSALYEVCLALSTLPCYIPLITSLVVILTEIQIIMICLFLLSFDAFCFWHGFAWGLWGEKHFFRTDFVFFCSWLAPSSLPLCFSFNWICIGFLNRYSASNGLHMMLLSSFLVLLAASDRQAWLLLILLQLLSLNRVKCLLKICSANNREGVSETYLQNP